MRSVELFTGAGGLALGIESAGFHHDAVVERNKYCCDTIRENQNRGFKLLDGWRLFSGDVRDFDYSGIDPGLDLLAGGPPCQPFSIGGKHRAFRDERDMFPQVVRAVRELQPQAILVENVMTVLPLRIVGTRSLPPGRGAASIGWSSRDFRVKSTVVLSPSSVSVNQPLQRLQMHGA